MAKKKSRKQIKKLTDKRCFFCKEDDYALLDVHRIVEGKDGGTYHNWNTITICSNCHRKVHAGEIKILGKRLCTFAPWILHYVEDGKEKFVPQSKS